MGADDNRILGVPLDGIGHVELEGCIAALVIADLPPVHPDVRPPIDGPEAHPYALIGREIGGYPETAAIPTDLRSPLRLMDAGELALPGKRHHDRAVVARGFGLLPAGL